MRESWDIGTALLTEYDDDGFIGVQVDTFGDGGSAPFELHHPLGTLARPRDPDADGVGCPVLFWREGSNGRNVHAWLLDDPRAAAFLPQQKKGGAIAGFSMAGSWDQHDGDDGTKTIYVPYDFTDASDPTTAQKAHLIQVGVDSNGDPLVHIGHGEGMAIVMLYKEGKAQVTIKNAAGDAFITVDEDGILVNGPLKAYGGFECGGDGAVPLAKVAELLTWATNVNAALNALGQPIAPMSPSVSTTLCKGL